MEGRVRASSMVAFAPCPQTPSPGAWLMTLRLTSPPASRGKPSTARLNLTSVVAVPPLTMASAGVVDRRARARPANMLCV
eukprot:4093237-Lingulodinium_polyedra.AAC.1